MGAVRIHNAKPGEGKIKQTRRSENIKRKQVSRGGGNWKDRSRSDEVGVDVEGHPGVLVGWVKTFPRRKGG